jgi:hypothetical protein
MTTVRRLLAVVLLTLLALAGCGNYPRIEPPHPTKYKDYTTVDFLEAAGWSVDDLEVEVGEPTIASLGRSGTRYELRYPANYRLGGHQLPGVLKAPKIKSDLRAKRSKIVLSDDTLSSTKLEWECRNSKCGYEEKKSTKHKKALAAFKADPLSVVLEHISYVVYAGELPLPSS